MFVNASESYTIVSEEQRSESILYPPVASLAPLVLPHILREVDEFRNEDEELKEAEPEIQEQFPDTTSQEQ